MYRANVNANPQNVFLAPSYDRKSFKRVHESSNYSVYLFNHDPFTFNVKKKKITVVCQISNNITALQTTANFSVDFFPFFFFVLTSAICKKNAFTERYRLFDTSVVGRW